MPPVLACAPGSRMLNAIAFRGLPPVAALRPRVRPRVGSRGSRGGPSILTRSGDGGALWHA